MGILAHLNLQLADLALCSIRKRAPVNGSTMMLRSIGIGLGKKLKSER